MAAKTDTTEEGTIVTVRPEPGERILVLDRASNTVKLPVETEQFWIVNPEAWRRATEEVIRQDILLEGCEQIQTVVTACQTDVISMHSRVADSLQRQIMAETREGIYRRERWTWAAYGAGGGVIIGALTALWLSAE